MEHLHAGVRWVFRFRAYLSLIFLAVIAVAVGMQISIVIALVIGLVFFIVPAEIYARMAYNRYLYEISSREVKIERGIIWKRYISIPYERIQNVNVHRGILARIFGFSTIDLETAGHSGFGFRYGRRNKRYESEGHLPAVGMGDAEKIRDFVMKKIKQTHSSGM
ncbi:MAG: PH domain-containing protein [Nanoarchaeota archaeon]|nr:PH domain-containing protein [Nanoarchaeota archaeon]